MELELFTKVTRSYSTQPTRESFNDIHIINGQLLSMFEGMKQNLKIDEIV